MPTSPDCKCKVINGRSGSVIENTSWILGRIVRDFPQWMDTPTKETISKVLDEKWSDLKVNDPQAKKPARSGLVVTIYRPSTHHGSGTPARDGVYWSGF